MYYSDTKINFLKYSKVKIGNIISLTQLKNNNHKKIIVGSSYIEGQSFEKDESQVYNPIKYKVQLSRTDENISEFVSNDGSFKIENLPDNENINLIVIDESKKYNGKYLKNIPVQLDYSKAMKIIRIYQVNNTAHIKIVFNGDPSAVAVFAQNATVEKIDTENYRLKGITGPYTVTLHDYIDNVLYTKESTFT